MAPKWLALFEWPCCTGDDVWHTSSAWGDSEMVRIPTRLAGYKSAAHKERNPQFPEPTSSSSTGALQAAVVDICCMVLYCVENPPVEEGRQVSIVAALLLLCPQDNCNHLASLKWSTSGQFITEVLRHNEWLIDWSGICLVWLSQYTNYHPGSMWCSKLLRTYIMATYFVYDFSSPSSNWYNIQSKPLNQNKISITSRHQNSVTGFIFTLHIKVHNCQAYRIILGPKRMTIKSSDVSNSVIVDFTKIMLLF